MLHKSWLLLLLVTLLISFVLKLEYLQMWLCACADIQYKLYVKSCHSRLSLCTHFPIAERNKSGPKVFFECSCVFLKGYMRLPNLIRIIVFE